jgi:hypothetical protein
MRRPLLFVLGLVGLLLGALVYLVRAPERAVQDAKFTPDGLTVVLVDWTGDPNIVRYDADRISHDQVTEFSKELCRDDVFQITEMTPTLLDKLRGQVRTMIACN